MDIFKKIIKFIVFFFPVEKAPISWSDSYTLNPLSVDLDKKVCQI